MSHSLVIAGTNLKFPKQALNRIGLNRIIKEVNETGSALLVPTEIFHEGSNVPH